jgi:hypothetical protein
LKILNEVVVKIDRRPGRANSIHQIQQIWVFWLPRRPFQSDLGTGLGFCDCRRVSFLAMICLMEPHPSGREAPFGRLTDAARNTTVELYHANRDEPAKTSRQKAVTSAVGPPNPDAGEQSRPP